MFIILNYIILRYNFVGGIKVKKIEFGFANDDEPKGSWQGIGIRDGLLLTDAIYYGAISFRDNNYIVAKVDKDEYGRFPSLVDKFIVRDALVDVYADGSNILFLNQEISNDAQTIQNILNNERIVGNIRNIDDIINLDIGAHSASKFFKLVELDDKIIATSITNEAFTTKNKAIKNCRYTISDMQRSLEASYKSR